MHAITPTLRLNDSNPDVVNLQDVLLALPETGRLRALGPPSGPTAEELRQLSADIAREREHLTFGRATQQFVRLFQIQQRLGVRDDLQGVVEEKTAVRLNQLLGLIDAPPAPPPSPSDADGFVVRGRVTGAGRNYFARAIDVDFRDAQPLGEDCALDADGNYEIRYTRGEFLRAEQATADVRISVLDESKGFVDASKIYFNAPEELTINIELGGAPVVPSEYDRYTSALKTIMGRVTLLQVHDEAPAKQNEDLEFLVGDTGIERQHILWLMLAAAAEQATLFGDTHPLPATAFYGWFRQGFPTDVVNLLERPTAALLDGLRQAIDAQLVPGTLSAELAAIGGALDRLRAQRALNLAAPDQPASLGDLLNTLPEHDSLSAADQFTFALLHSQHGATDALWKAASDAGLAAKVPALQRTLALADLTSNHGPLIGALQAQMAPEHPQDIEYLTQLEPLAWLKLVFEHGTPPGSAVSEEEYNNQLQVGVERRFPRQILTKQLRQQLPDGGGFPTDKVVAFVNANPSFDAETEHAEHYLHAAGVDDDVLREGLLQLQRVHALTSGAAETAQLLGAGFGSAAQIVAMGAPLFAAEMGAAFKDEQAIRVFAVAETVVATSIALSARFGGSAAPSQVISTVSAGAPSAAAQSKYPSLRALFGDLDYCECQHCQSVLGPAAYLTDLMHFLQRSPLIPNQDGRLLAANIDRKLDPRLELAVGNTALAALLQRRPDLGDLQLSCDNTDTQLPYLDLVLEILENAVAFPFVVDFDGVDVGADFTDAIIAAMRKAGLTVGKTPTVISLTKKKVGGTLALLDGPRRWSLQYGNRNQLWIERPGQKSLRVEVIEDAVAALDAGTLNAELKGLLAQSLPLDGQPTISAIPKNSLLEGWTVEEDYAVAVKLTAGATSDAAQLFKLDGAPFSAQPTKLKHGTATKLAKSFRDGDTSTISSTVAQLLGLPPTLSYAQTWNAASGWWELRTRTTASVIRPLAVLTINGLSYQSSSIHEQLESSPENRNAIAYDKLASAIAVFPWELPFDLWLEETRAFLQELGVPRAALIDLARPQARFSEEGAVLERLGLAKAEADLILAAQGAAEPWRYWGLAETNNQLPDHTAGSTVAGGWKEVLRHLSLLLQQAGLSYREYLDLSQTTFGGTSKPLLNPPGECKTSNIALVSSDADFVEHLQRVHAFTRLWRKSGWSMQELDRALSAFGGTLSATTFADLALLKRVQGALPLPVSVLVACIFQLAPQPHTDYAKTGSPSEPSPFDRIYQRPSLRGLGGFADLAFDQLAASALKISARADYLAAALGLKPEQVRAWLTGSQSLGCADVLNLDGLSRFYAAASVCRALHISADALGNILKLLGNSANPFRTLTDAEAAAAPAARVRARALLNLVEQIAFVRAAGFDFETLGYLLQNQWWGPGATTAAAHLEQQLVQTLSDVRVTMQSGPVLGDASIDNVRRQLDRLGWYAALSDAILGADALRYQPRGTVKVALAAEPNIPLSLRSKMTYLKVDAATATWTSSALLSAADIASLGAAGLAPDAATALNDDYQAQLDAHTNNLGVLLETLELPDLPVSEQAVTGLTNSLPVIPDALKDHLTFAMTSATTGTLKLRGWLSDADTASFAATDPARAAASTLQTTAEGKKPPASPESLRVARDLLVEPSIDARFFALLLRLAPRLDHDLLIGQLGTAFSTDPALVDAVSGVAKLSSLTVASFLRSDAKLPPTRSAWPDQFDALERLGKLTTVADRLSIKPDQIGWALSGIFFALPTTSDAPVAYAAWRKLVELFRLRDVVPDGARCVAQIHTTLQAKPAPDLSVLRGLLAGAYELSASQADDACGGSLLAFDTAAIPNDYNDPARLLQLAQLLQVAKLLGTGCLALEPLIRPAPGESAAQTARTLFAASIDAAAFAERMRPVSNRLRNLQRDALVAYLVDRDHLEDSNELFDRYLIDVEMGPCMLTSRIKQAISSVQLFVQRCLLNLERPVTPSEPGVSPTSIDVQRWQWMKYYRVWEANRKVFLYPENWIEPELRDDKTPIFRVFESDLQQSELTSDTAVAAFRKYIEGFSDINNLTLVSLFEESLLNADDEVTGTVVHAVGRDNSQPYKHYYQRWDVRPTPQFGTWTAWEEISIQIDSEHVLIFHFGGSVYVAWPSITGQDQSWHVRMNLAKRAATGWTKLKKGRGELTMPMPPTASQIADDRRGLAFRLAFQEQARTVSVDCYGPAPREVGEEPQTKTDPRETLTCNISLRVLAAYTYKYPDGSSQTRYRRADDVTLEVGVTSVGYDYVSQELKFIGAASYAGGSAFQLLGAPLKFALANFPLAAPFVTTLHLDITLLSNKYKVPSPARRAFNVTASAGLTWLEDFIFELKDDPKWETSSSELTSAGSFLMRDDESFEWEQLPLPALPAPPAGTEYFMSGYQGSTPNSSVELPDAASQLITNSAGYYLLMPAAQSRASARQTWGYRDEQKTLLFWKSGQDSQYRTVPFTTEGLLDLRAAVAEERLSDAMALPATLKPEPAVDGDVDKATSITAIEVNFNPTPTSVYNWEVYFHMPLLVATRLSQGQRFEEAQRWFHLIFDPTTNEAPTGSNEAIRYWRFLPFRQAGQGEAIDAALEDLAQGKPTAEDVAQGNLGPIALKDHISEWADNPFQPHLVARHRLRSYQFAVVLKYLQNLIDWGDQRFRADTIETINEATQLYVLAAKILGKRPASSPKSAGQAKSYRDIQAQLDDFSNAWEPFVPSVRAVSSSMKQAIVKAVEPLASLGSLYFCVPGNDKLDSFWDTIADRLFKIRNCMNIDGLERQLPLFEPPIDPALLVRATAAGLDLSAVLAGLQSPLPLYRFSVMLQKALEICGEVRGLGGALLGALEKKDAEELSLLRSTHELQLLKLARIVKVEQHEEASANLEALRKTRALTVQRFLNCQRLLGRQNALAPEEGAAATLEAAMLRPAAKGTGDGDTQSLALTGTEDTHMEWLNVGNNYAIAAGIFNTAAGIFHALPDHAIGPERWGGSHMGHAANSVGSFLSMLATNASFQASRSSIIGGHQRRYDEWQFQSNTAARELEQIDKQIIASEIRVQIAQQEVENHDQQMENARDVDELMRDKFTNQQLYSWIAGQIAGVYFRSYQLALDFAKRAERTYRQELGLADSSFIAAEYWDNLKKGLQVGERLYLDLKRLDAAYLDKNKREYEITKHVSILQLDPLALLRLKEVGRCEINIPEALLDLDFPGHYLRRIKAVSLSIPCVAGPYSSVSCTLTLQKHSIRNSSGTASGYARADNDDARFSDTFGAIQSIATSSGQNDAGMFETNLRDERYLPFEGAGVISSWVIELPNKFRQFNYESISDVILHLRYTARDGGALLNKAAVGALESLIAGAAASGSVRLLSMRQDFPSEWAMFTSAQNVSDASPAALTFKLRPEHYPYWSVGQLQTIRAVELFARPGSQPTVNVYDTATPAIDSHPDAMTLAGYKPLLSGKLDNVAGPANPVGAVTLYFSDNSVKDLWLALTWGP